MAMKRLLMLAAVAACLLLMAPRLVAQSTGELDGPMTEDPRYNRPKQPQKPLTNTPPPRGTEESSSQQTKIDLSPPLEDATAGGNKGRASDDVGEMHPYNPLRSMKDVEVGNYYYDRGNYKAALLRYRDALEFKPRDAVATFRLAMVLEKLKEYPEAMARYQEYLSILKDGPSSGDARKALERLRSMPATAPKSPTATQTTAKESAAPAGNSKATEASPR